MTVLYLEIFFLISVHCANLNINDFPSNFLFGVSTSAYQIEGACNESEKGESIWYRFTHKNPLLISDKTNGDIACISYHTLKEDVNLLKNLGVDFYHFSFSWSRILPNGLSYKVNPSAINYYNDLINLLIQNGIKPVATIFNWDLPQIIQDLGGFSNELIIDWFEDYVKVLFKNFGNRVRMWITVSEPQSFCRNGYGSYKITPGINMSYTATFFCLHNVLKSHVKIYHLYNKTFNNDQNGKVGIGLESFWSEPTDPLRFQWFADPIFGNGTSDFCAISHYQQKHFNGTEIAAERFSKSLKFIKHNYGSIPILIVKNGVADNGTTDDEYRVEYLRIHLETLLTLVVEENVNVIGYSVWSLLDNFDWNNGYLAKYGLYQVNFSDSERWRVAKSSAKFYSEFLNDRKMYKNTTDSFCCHSVFIITFLLLVNLLFKKLIDI